MVFTAKKILIIEDHLPTTEMEAGFLGGEGYEMLAANNGADGIRKAIAEKPDLILLDIMMPEMNGFEVCQALKGDPKTAKIPVIIVSVRASEDNISKGKEYGADEYITKPFDPFRLLEAVKKYIK